jgi:hypothetical protein
VIVPLAHAGHWAVGLLYLAPVAIVVGFLAWQAWQDRRDPRPLDAEDPDDF